MTSHLHEPAVSLYVGVRPHKEVEACQGDGQEGDREDVDGDGEEAADLLLLLQGLDVSYQLLVLIDLPGEIIQLDKAEDHSMTTSQLCTNSVDSYVIYLGVI